MKRNILLILCGISWLVIICQISFGQKPDLFVQSGHSSEITTIAISPDGKLLASGGWDNTIILWDIKSSRQIKSIIGHNGLVYSVKFSPNGKTLASGSVDKTIKLWDIESGKEIKTFKEQNGLINSVAFSPNGKFLVSGGADKRVKLWDIESGNEIESFQGEEHTAEITYMAFSPNGKLIASTSSDSTIKLWDINTHKLKYTLKNDLPNHSIGFSPDGLTLVSGDWKGIIKIWNVNTGTLNKKLASHNEPINSVQFSPDGKTIASGSWMSDEIKLWDVNTGEMLRHFEASLGDYGYFASSVTFSPDGKVLVSGGRKIIKFWNIDEDKQLPSLKGLTDSVKKLSISPKGNALASVGTLTFQFWEFLKETPHRSLDDKNGLIREALFSSGGEIIAIENYEDTIQLLNLNTKKSIDLNGKKQLGSSTTFSINSKLFAFVSDDSIKIFNAITGKEVKIIERGESNSTVTSLKFSNDGKTIATFGWGKVIELWDVKSGVLVKTLTSDSDVFEVAFSPNDDLLVSANRNKTVGLWKLKLPNQSKFLKGHMQAVITVGISPDGETIISGGLDRTVKLWSIKTGEPIASFENHSSWINSVVFFPNGKFIAAGCEDGLIYLWEIKEKRLTAKLISLDKNDWLVTTPEGFFDGTPNAWKQLIWRFNNNTFDYASVETYFNDFFYPNLLQDVLAGKSPQPKAGSELEKIDRRQPKVEILSVNGQTKEQVANQVLSEKRMVSVSVEVADNNAEKKQATQATATSGAQDLRLFRNGSLVKVWHGDVFALGKADGCEQIRKTGEARRVRCQVDVPIIAGENNFSAYAFNSSNVKSNDDVISIKGAESLKRKGTLYVLNIGVNDYQGISKLKYAVDDAKDLGAELQKQQQKLQKFASTEVITLTDAEATKENILLALKRFRNDAEKGLPQNAPKQLGRIKQLAPEDALLISFSGHGVADGERFYLLPQDYNSSRIKESAVSDVELNEVLEKVDAGQLLFIIDACQSGQALGQDKEGRGPMNSKGLAQLAYDKGMYILTAAQSYQAAFEVSRTLTGKDIKHGLLSFALLEALTTNKAVDANGNVTDRSWFNYAVEEVPRMQLEEMKKRQGKGSELLFSNNDNKNIEAEKRRVQTPRIFYRREESQNPFIVAKP